MSDRDPIIICASREFITLCKSQIALLTTALGASMSAVYVAEDLLENTQAKLIEIAVYPENDTIWSEDTRSEVIPQIWGRWRETPRLPRAALPEAQKKILEQESADSTATQRQQGSLRMHRQIVLPLIYEDVVVGLLVTGRSDRQWNQQEYAQIERIATTIASARLLDRRLNWYRERLDREEKLRTISQNRLDDFLHQLRNPITALRTFSKLLLKRLLPEDRNQTVARSMLRESERLQELVQQFDREGNLNNADSPLILQPAKHSLAQGATTSSSYSSFEPENTLSLEPISLREILDPLLTSAGAIACDRDINLTYHIRENLAPVKANAMALREVASNLIDNALKYTPAGGRVDVEAGIELVADNERLCGISIRDTGCGIPPEDRERIFDRHYRGIQAAGDIPGTGLGLAIAKELVEQMHGFIELISSNTSPQKGTTFIIWLPVTDN